MGVTKNGGESTLGSSRELILNTTYLNYKGINSHLDGDARVGFRFGSRGGFSPFSPMYWILIEVEYSEVGFLCLGIYLDLEGDGLFETGF
ncbi:hypothetical protein RchiOBHm_Chr1g0378821 [Rosa chinensis]|uniref:Uncharacterized protein n=1 Tax=Rosa chinensis TaxID=74649 RepID=A0A2P6SNI2_ROSCH|nr:hypothetical protein RchiOBHm_Chr1g0378821 [Rosa chinensis]